MRARLAGDLSADRIRSNLATVRERIARACERSGRDPDAIELLAATKYVPVDELEALARGGIELVGENVARDLAEKHARFGDRFTFDFIGHLQSRKTKEVLPLVRLIHSVESESVLAQVERHASEPVRLLLEVNVAGERSKHGVAPEDAESFLETASAYPKAVFAGLMTMPPVAGTPGEARPHFTALRELAERLQASCAPPHDFSVLSMGTSQDFEVGVEEGATVLRLGNVLYA